MDANIAWLENSTAKCKSLVAANLQQLVAGTDEGCFGPASEIEALPLWQRGATTKAALSVSETRAAVLPKLPFKDDDIARVPGWKKALNQLAGIIGKNVEPLLRDIVFQHAHSTNGRWNASLGRWERWGVRSVDEWCCNPFPELIGTDPNPVKLRLFSIRTFHRHKDVLVKLGLIEAESHLWQGKTCLWIKPSERLARIMFEPGYWASVKGEFQLDQTKKKPRGFSKEALHYKEERSRLFKKAMAGHCGKLPEDQRIEIFYRLTKHIQLAKNYRLNPLVRSGSDDYWTLIERLQLTNWVAKCHF